ncbi:MAG: chemotaxis protein MotB [Saprospiraceae bacterium]|jgi:chemotaxis protein MotB
MIFLFFVTVTSCVSNKKHLEEIITLQKTHQITLEEVELRFQAASTRTTELEYKLVEESGANRALAGMQIVYMKQLDSLQNALSNLGSNAQSTQQDLDLRLQSKDTQIESLQQKIADTKTAIDNRGKITRGVVNELAGVMSSFESTEALIDQQGSTVKILLFDDMMFRSNSMRIRTKGLDALTKISEVLGKYPALTFEVIGHTDNRIIKGYKNNWSFSALRAAEVVLFLTEEADVNRNQIIACGKGEFSPRDSNESSAGRKDNRRIEIVISEEVNATIRKMNKILE